MMTMMILIDDDVLDRYHVGDNDYSCNDDDDDGDDY
jgi:hypothetical protein